MRKVATLIFFSVLLVSKVQADISISNLLESGKAVSTSENFDPDYLLVKSNYQSANGPQLFYAAIVEAHLGNKLESVKYIISGQIRSTTDMALFEPSTETDKALMSELYGLIFYRFGGAGGNDIYKDEKSYSKVFDNISSYNPLITDSYNPGWGHTNAPSELEYLDLIAQGKKHRLKQLIDLVSLLKNDEYVALKKELDELQKQKDGGGNKALEIINKMREISGSPKIPVTK